MKAIGMSPSSVGRKTLLSLFKDASNCFSDKLAVVSNRGESNVDFASYQEVSEESAKICSCLEEYATVATTTCQHVQIGVCMEPTLCVPAVILGILDYGATFVCIDPNKREEQFSQLNVKWIFTISNRRFPFLDILKVSGKVLKEIIVHGIVLDLWDVSGPDKVGISNCTSNIAYAIMTSGTTGEPKLIQVPHDCIVPNIEHLRDILAVQNNDVILLSSPLTFDPSVIEMFLALSSGAALLIIPNDIKASPQLLLKELFPKCASCPSVTIIQSTPSIISRWTPNEIKNIVLGPNSSLRALVLGGEPCPDRQVLKHWGAMKTKAVLYNVYGITEVSCWASICKIDLNEKFKSIPLGMPLSKTLFQVKNKSGDEVKVGVGELFIGSNTRICLLDDEKEGIVQGVVYRASGDLVSVDATSRTITYVCRKDSLIKRWGHRVCLSQIEKVAAQHCSVENSCCIWNTRSHTLALFIKIKDEVEKSEETDISTELQTYMSKSMPPPSVPDIIKIINTFPLTLHGKINKRMLLSQLRIESKEKTEVPANCVIESVDDVKRLWMKYINCSEINPDDSFLLLGGNSFIALQLVTELQSTGRKLPINLISLLLQDTTFNEFCSYLLTNLTCSPLITNSDLKKRNRPEDLQNYGIFKKIKETQVNAGYKISEENAHPMTMSRGRNFNFVNGNKQSENNKYFTKVNDVDKIQLENGWLFDLGKCIDASPLLIELQSSSTIVVIGSHSHRLAILNSASGVPTAQTGSLSDRIESSACVSLCGTKIFVGCYDGKLHCLDVTTGESIWQHQAGGMIKSSPTLCLNGTAIAFGAYDNKLYCIYVQNGSLVWTVQPGAGSIYSSPCVSDQHGLVYTACLDGTSSAVSEADGTVKWSLKLAYPVFSSPSLVSGDHQLVIAEVCGAVHGLDALHGNKLWTYQAGGNIFSSFCTPVISGASQLVLFGCHDHFIYCLELTPIVGTALKWKSKLDAPVFATPFAFPIDSPRIHLISVATTTGSIYLLNLETGIIKCQNSLPLDVFSSPIVYKNQLIVGCRDNNVYSLNIV